LLEGSEEAVAAIEAKQRVIEQIGLDNYLANQVTA
jgi:bacterioferritin (cytochrome b1)